MDRPASTGVAPGLPSPTGPMSWLIWLRDGNDYVAGDYRIRLLAPYRWELLYRDTHLRFDPKLSSALAQAEHHYLEGQRFHDLAMWAMVLLGSVVAAVVMDLTVGLSRLWSIPLFCAIVFVGLSALVRLLAAASRDRFNPYRRRAPSEPRNWWQR